MSVEQQRRLSCMNPIEIRALKSISNRLMEYNLMPIVKALRKMCIIDEQSFDEIQKLWRPKDIYKALIEIVPLTCSLKQLIKALFEAGFRDIARILYISFINCKSNRINHIKRVHPTSRTKYFNNMKQLVQDNVLKDDFSILSNNLQDKILTTTEDVKKMQLCDMFVALKAVEMDSLTNTTSIVHVHHKGYQDIEQIINKTSNEALSRVILHSRYAIALSTTDNLGEAESHMRNARVNADSFGSCVEVTDMIYKSIVIDLTILENDPDNESFRKDILFKAEEGLWTLIDQEEDVRLFWTKGFLIRMVYAYLGIGKSSRIIKDYSPSLESIVKAETILRHSCLQNLEHRRKMLYHVAKARVSELKGEYQSAISYITQARELAINGNYASISPIKEYEKFLTNQLERGLDIWNKRENNQGLCFDNQPSIRLSSFESTSHSSYESDDMSLLETAGKSLNETNSDEDETDAKQPLTSFEGSKIVNETDAKQLLTSSEGIEIVSKTDAKQLLTPSKDSEIVNDTDAKLPSKLSERSKIVVGNIQSFVISLEELSPNNRNVTRNDSFGSLEHLRLSSFENVPSCNQHLPRDTVQQNITSENESFPSLEHLHLSSVENS